MHGSEEMDGWMERKTDFYYAMPPPNTLKMSNRLTYLLSLIAYYIPDAMDHHTGAGCRMQSSTGYWDRMSCHRLIRLVDSIQLHFISFNPIQYNTIQSLCLPCQ
eukprot:216535_1